MYVWEKFTQEVVLQSNCYMHIHELLVRISGLNHTTGCSQDLEFSAAGTP